MCPEETATGMALSNDGKGSRRAYVFSSREIGEAERSLTQVRFLNRQRAQRATPWIHPTKVEHFKS